MKNVIHVMVTGDHRRGRDAVAQMIEEMMMTYGMEIADGQPFPKKPNPFAVIRTVPDVEIRVEVR